MSILHTISNLLKEQDNYEIITHVYPDGDTLGGAFALCHALQVLGKKAHVIIVPESLPDRFVFLTEGIISQDFEASVIISVDVPSTEQLGHLKDKYEGKIDICIDHHESNSILAKYRIIDPDAAAACEIIYDLICLLNVPILKEIAGCIYTGISTDTGCFKYINTRAKTHLIAARVMDAGCDWPGINQIMFEIKSRPKIAFERMVYDTLEFFANGKIALIHVPVKMLESAHLSEDQAEDIASIPKRVEGVLIGITMREKKDGTYKISVRTGQNVNASKFCSIFGGGGHSAAAGCIVSGDFDYVKQKLITEAEKIL